jgi:hypothetical protein
MRGQLFYRNSGLFDYRGQLRLRGESEPCTLANCRAQELFPIGPEAFLECADSAHCKAEGSSTFFKRGLE